MDPVNSYLRQHVVAGDWPGAVAAFGSVGARPKVVFQGRLAIEPIGEPLGSEALYDLASLTKVLSTSIILVRLASRGLIDLDEPLTAWLPEFVATPRGAPSYHQLMTHSAGFPAWRPLRSIAACTEDVVQSLARLDRDPQQASYSDLGPILAGLVLERQCSVSLEQLFVLEVLGQLRLEPDQLRFGPLPAAQRARAAPTEADRPVERTMTRELGLEWNEPVRSDQRRGEVHDGNAEFLRGVAGHAGLFGTASAVYAAVSALWAGDLGIEPRERQRLCSTIVLPDGDVRSFGFQSGQARSSIASHFGPDSLGHTGFTGTSLWCEPVQGQIAVLLTNRVHPRWREAAMQDWRREFHRLCWEELTRVRA
jgi:CubicO group peptidase (beta-lactamase class C family)